MENVLEKDPVGMESKSITSSPTMNIKRKVTRETRTWTVATTITMMMTTTSRIMTEMMMVTMKDHIT